MDDDFDLEGDFNEELKLAEQQQQTLLQERLITNGSHDHDDMDPETFALIQSMLEEDAALESLFNSSTSASKKASPAGGALTKKRKLVSNSDADSPNHPSNKRGKPQTSSSSSSSSKKPESFNTRWTQEEDDRLKSGISIYGYGPWKVISGHVMTRNSLQCKNRARALAEAGVVSPFTKPMINSSSSSSSSISTTVSQNNNAPPKVGAPKSVSPVRSTVKLELPEPPAIVQSSKILTSLSAKPVKSEGDDEVDIMLEDDDEELEQTRATHSTLPDAAADSETNGMRVPDAKGKQPQINLPTLPTDTSTARTTKAMPQSANTTTTPLTETHTNGPTLLLDRLRPHPLEIAGCPEFFIHDNPHLAATLPSTFSLKKNKKKDAQRYLRIRNFILDAWQAQPLKYLTKTVARRGLKGEGDVHAISRVHAFLERIGCINYGLDEDAPARAGSKNKKGGGGSIETDGAGGGGSSKTGFDEDNLPTGGAAIAGEDESWKIISRLAGLEARRRRRRIRNEKGVWVDPSELRDGRVIMHGEDGKPLSDDEETPMSLQDILEERRLMAKNAKYFTDEELAKYDTNLINLKRKRLQRQYYHYGGGNQDDPNDPFRLIPLSHYYYQDPSSSSSSPSSSSSAAVVAAGGAVGASDIQPPFRVHVKVEAMIVMDLHSHLSDTEIIGLMGGRYDSASRILYVEEVFPCKSVSTGIQCEMDPASEVQAHLWFSSRNRTVVGWYHSHPTFDPNPSVRDVETQEDHQKFFARDEDGVQPFVGAIWSPWGRPLCSHYHDGGAVAGSSHDLGVDEELDAEVKEDFAGKMEDKHDDGLSSQVTWVFVEKQNSKGVPYSCVVSMDTSLQGLNDGFVEKLKELVDEYKEYEFRTDLTLPFTLSETVASQKTPITSQISRLDKVLAALRAHVQRLREHDHEASGKIEWLTNAVRPVLLSSFER